MIPASFGVWKVAVSCGRGASKYTRCWMKWIDMKTIHSPNRKAPSVEATGAMMRMGEGFTSDRPTSVRIAVGRDRNAPRYEYAIPVNVN